MCAQGLTLGGRTGEAQPPFQCQSCAQGLCSCCPAPLSLHVSPLQCMSTSTPWAELPTQGLEESVHRRGGARPAPGTGLTVLTAGLGREACEASRRTAVPRGQGQVCRHRPRFKKQWLPQGLNPRWPEGGEQSHLCKQKHAVDRPTGPPGFSKPSKESSTKPGKSEFPIRSPPSPRPHPQPLCSVLEQGNLSSMVPKQRELPGWCHKLNHRR